MLRLPKTRQVVEDADCNIINVEFDKSTSLQSVLIVKENVDLFILLNSLGSAVKNVFLPKKWQRELWPLTIFVNLIQPWSFGSLPRI